MLSTFFRQKGTLFLQHHKTFFECKQCYFQKEHFQKTNIITRDSRSLTFIRRFSVASERAKPNSRKVLMPLCLQMPHPAKVAKCGEDTYFIANNYLTVGVFDGVGGWAFEGIDPRQYSSNFAMKCKEAVDQMSICEPKKIMEYAYNNTQNIMGSTFVSHIYHNSFSFLSFATSTKKEKSFEFVFSGQL
jgi:hypothetical protein